MIDLLSEKTKELQFIPNLSRVMKASKYDRLYIYGAISALSVVFSPAEIYAKVIVIIAAVLFGFFKGLSLIYNINILKNPITIDSETNILSYFDEFKIKRQSIDLNLVNMIRVFYKNNNPYILEFTFIKDSKKIEDNINLDAFDNGVVQYLINSINELKPNIDIIKKNLEHKNLKSNKLNISK